MLTRIKSLLRIREPAPAPGKTSVESAATSAGDNPSGLANAAQKPDDPVATTDATVDTASATPKRPTRTFPQFFRHVKTFDFEPRTVIDVGVAKGTPPLYEAFPEAYFVLVEPVEDFVPHLEKIVEKYRGEFHTCALTAEPGTAKILKTDALHGSTMMHRLDEDDERLQVVEKKTLDALLDERDVEGPLLLKTDCQGGDFDVLKGGIKTLQRCELVIVEVSLFRFWGAHHPDPLDILNFMDAQGFVIYDFLDGLFRPTDAALGQIDIAFVKRDGMFRQYQAW